MHKYIRQILNLHFFSGTKNCIIDFSWKTTLFYLEKVIKKKI